MPAGGGVIQIAAVGRQNAHLNGNADHTLFKTQHRRYTSFAEDLEYNDFSSGTVGFGQKVSASVSRYGDLVSDLMLEVSLPAIVAPTGDTTWSAVVDASGDALTAEPAVTGAYWVNAIGFALICEVQIEIGGTEIDTLYPEWMYFWEEMTQRPGARLGEQIGKFTYSEDVESDMVEFASQARTLFVPLQFWFNKYFMEHGLSIPLIALSYHEIRVRVTFRSIAECTVVYFEDAALDGTTSGGEAVTRFTSVSLTPVNSATTSTLVSADLEARLLVSYVYLDAEERNAFSSVEHEYLITTVQRQQHNITSALSTSDQIKIFFNHPSNCLTWMIRPSNYTDNGARRRYSVGHKDMFDFSLATADLPTVALPYGDVTDATKSASLTLNGHSRWPTDLPGLFFRQTVPVMKWTNASDGYMYVFNFSARGGAWQPSSTLNMSRIDHVQLELKYGANMPVSDVLIFAESYNLFIVKEGMGGIRYSN